MKRFVRMTYEMRESADLQPSYERLVRVAPGRFGIVARLPDGTSITAALGPFRWPSASDAG